MVRRVRVASTDRATASAALHHLEQRGPVLVPYQALQSAGVWLICAVGCLMLPWGSGCTPDNRDARCPPGSLLSACRQRCSGDGECLAPARCDALTRTCQRPAVACDPLAPRLSPADAPRDGGSSTGGQALGEDRCAADQDCDLITRTCVPLPGARCARDNDCRVGELCAGSTCTPAGDARSCQRDADCAPPAVCRRALSQGKLISVCAGPLGPSEGGSRCRANVDCQSGLCLRSGVCYAGCSPMTMRTDCHGHDGVGCGQVAIALGAEQDPTGTMPTAVVPSCTLQPPQCQGDRDCEMAGATCQIALDSMQPSRLQTICLLARGTVRPSGPCTRNSDCSTGLCQGTYCFAACRSGADCRSGFACRASTYKADGLSARVQSCVPGRTCMSRAGCTAVDESCAPQPVPSEDALELVCTPGVGGAAGQACKANSDCATGSCSERGLCVGGCASDRDCPRGPKGETELCRPQAVRVRGIAGVVNSCQIAPPSCRRDGDCSDAGAICRPFPSLDDPSQLAPGCGPAPNPSGRASGSVCSSGSDCRSGNCLTQASPPVCYGLCGSDVDCVSPRRCYAESVWLLTGGTAGQPSATYDATSACLPDVGSRRACAGDGGAADCPASELCTLLPDAHQLAFVKRCQKAVGSKGPGAICTDDKDCSTGRCQLPGGATGKRCIAPCSTTGPNICTAGATCRAGTLDVRPGKVASLTFCQ